MVHFAVLDHPRTPLCFLLQPQAQGLTKRPHANPLMDTPSRKPSEAIGSSTYKQFDSLTDAQRRNWRN